MQAITADQYDVSPEKLTRSEVEWVLGRVLIVAAYGRGHGVFIENDQVVADSATDDNLFTNHARQIAAETADPNDDGSRELVVKVLRRQGLLHRICRRQPKPVLLHYPAERAL